MLRQDMLKSLHESHNGITETKLQALQILYWPGIDTDIENYISIIKNQTHKEPVIPHSVPDYPFECIGRDIDCCGYRLFIEVVRGISYQKQAK